MKPIRNTELRKKLWETLTDHLDGSRSEEWIFDLCMCIEMDVMSWVAEEGLKPEEK